MAITNLYAAESWEKVYQAFEQVSFVSYDFDTVKQSLLDYIKLYYKESFNDFIESDELMAYVEVFAYVAEQLAYRVDITAHENFITTAERKQSILRLAKLISYTASRNIPARGLVKITSVSTTETVYDSQGNNLAGTAIVWNDPNNSAWKEQFFLVVNRVFTKKFGQPSKVQQVGDIAFQLYSFNNDTSTMAKGVFAYSVDTASQTLPMEIVPVDLDENGPLERSPDPQNTLSVLYSNDGLGDSSDLTGFMLFTKQGTLIKTDVTMTAQVPNQSVLVNINNLNDTDVWVQQTDGAGKILVRWTKAETVNAQNLFFSTDTTRSKYEVETLENDRVNIIFGDGNFSDIPSGNFTVWTRQSDNSNATIPKSSIVNQSMSLSYKTSTGSNETCAINFGLTSTLQNASASEDIEHIRQTAPSTYYSQGRMVNGQDYNTFLLRDPSILRLKTVNRTFAGQPKYLDWNDASGNYENVKIFGDDLTIYNKFEQNSQTSVSSSRRLIDTDLEPLLATSGIQNILTHLVASYLPGVTTTPRLKFIEDVSIVPDAADPTVKLQEKTRIQGLLDRHWYGEPTGFVTINGVNCAIVDSDSDGNIWQDNIPTTADGVSVLSTANGVQPISDLPSFGLRFQPVFAMVGDGSITAPTSTSKITETVTIEISSDPTIAYVTGSVSGKQPNATVNSPYTGLINFTITSADVSFAQGDAFVFDVVRTGSVTTVVERLFTLYSPVFSRVNLNGEWVTIPGNNLDTTSGVFDPNAPNAAYDSSWLIKVDRNTDSFGNITSYTLTYRDLKLAVTSPTTKFWYNSSAQILDSDTLLPVSDRVSVLKSNLKASGLTALGVNNVYNVVGPVRDSNGIVDVHSLEISPLVNSSSGRADDPLQFEKFAEGHYTYTKTSGVPAVVQSIDFEDIPVTFATGSVTAYDLSSTADTPVFYTRTLIRGAGTDALDFMWQHFSPFGNLIDPAPSNIHDAFILTSGYYSSLRDYLEGRATTVPVEPTPLELRNSYGTLLQSKMLSDTLVLHPAKIKLLFGSLAQPELRAKFKIVRNPSGTLTDDQIRSEVLSVINTYFSIDNWDFGTTFYATELISLIHHRMPLDVASAVIVPIFANNSFGSLFTIEAGTSEILQSAAVLSDIEMVDYLSASVLRQGSL